MAGEAFLTEINQTVEQEEQDARNTVEVPSLSEQYQQSLQDPDVQADIGEKDPAAQQAIQLTGSDDDYLPYLHEIEEDWDLREQAYQDKQNGKNRQPGDVSNEYLKPGRRKQIPYCLPTQ